MRTHRRWSGSSGGGGQRPGVPRPNGRATVDDAGEFYPLGLTFMWSLQGAQNEPGRYRQNLEWAAAKGFDFKRPLYEVGWAPPLTINPGAAKPDLPTFPDHLGAVARDLDLSYSLGIRSGITLSGKGTGYNLEQLAGDVGGVIADGRAHKVLIVEMQNEYSNGGDPVEVLQRMARKIRPLIPNMLALSYFDPPAGADTPEAIDSAAAAWRAEILAAGGIVMIRHTARSNADYGWRDQRQPYDFHSDIPLVGTDWEGPGPGSSGTTNSNPLQLAMKRAVAAMCGAPIFVLHTGTGVYGDGRPSNQGAPRPPNFWEIENIDAICSALRGIDALLPPGLPNWTVANTGWVAPNPVAPFQPHAYWEGSSGEGVNKAYAALGPNGEVIQMPCGVRGHARMTASYPLREVLVWKLSMDGNQLATEKFAENLSFNAGESMDLPGGGQDAMVAYIIRGRR